MLAKVISAATVGLDSVPIEVEVHVDEQGFPGFNIVGLPDKAVEEAKERVRSALKNSGAKFPDRRITVNLAPADLPKEGPAYDLPIALGLLIASGQLQADLSQTIVIGELSLDGQVRPTTGILPAALLAQEKRFSSLFLPAVNAPEASLIKNINIYPIQSIKQAFNFLSHLIAIQKQAHTPFRQLPAADDFHLDMAEIKGQEHAKRALEIAAAGGHHLYMTGPPGSGKTMLAQALTSILPDLAEAEALEVTKIYSIAGNLPPGQAIIRSRPFRHPHHTASRISLIGGGSHPRPGEISLAHRGILFLDEFPEFPRSVLESLRQPLEDGLVQVSRVAATHYFPSQFLLVAAANPCPCGYFGSPSKPCTCSTTTITRYQKRISGPLLDRIDIHLTVPQVDVHQLSPSKKPSATSQAIKSRVQLARNHQLKRFTQTKIYANSEMNLKQLKKYCPLSPQCLDLLTQATAKLGLTARSYYKLIKISRTIADLEGSNNIQTPHLAEALQYRPPNPEFS